MKLYAPEGCTSCSVGGQSYEVAEDGRVDVPDENAAELLPHGFSTASPTDAASEEVAGAARRGRKAKAASEEVA